MVRMSPIETVHLVFGNLITSKRLRKPLPLALGALGCFSIRFASIGEPKMSCFSLLASLLENVCGCMMEVRVLEGVAGTDGLIEGLGLGVGVGVALGIMSGVGIMSVEGG